MAGLAGSGVDVLRLGVIPTPAVAFLTRDLGADLGVMLSASHNPAPDNGIKLFGRGGFKLPDAVEDEIEAHLGMPPRRRSDLPAGFGRVADATTEPDRYLDHLLASVAHPAAGNGAAGPWPASPSSWTARTAPPPRSRRGCCSGPEPRSSRSVSSRTGTTSTPAADPLTWRPSRRR